MKPVVGIATVNASTELPLAWDMPGAFWDEGLFWDSEIFQSKPLVPTAGVQSFKPVIDTNIDRIVIGLT